MELELNYNEISDIRHLIIDKLKYINMLKNHSECYEEYEYWISQIDAIRPLVEKFDQLYKDASEEIGELPY